jgi:hypothetical protein
MEIIPMTREAMRRRKAEEDERRRQYEIQTTTEYIYKQAVQFAGTNQTTCFQFSMNHNNLPTVAQEVCEALQALFPDCTIGCMKGPIQTRSSPYKPAEFVICGQPGINFNQPGVYTHIVIDWS